MATNLVEKLPESVLLNIFHNFPSKDLGRVGMVCKNWHRIASDYSLWQHVDLRGLRLKKESVIALIEKVSPFVSVMNISGCGFTIAFITTVAKKCVKLKTLSLQGAHFIDLDYDFHLSWTSFKTLENLDVRFLEGLCANTFIEHIHLFRSIQSLGLANINSSGELERIFKSLRNLRVVHCQNCPSLTDSHIDILADSCPKLESLCLTGCIYVTGSTFPRLIGKCKNLQTLLMSCTRLQNSNIIKTDWSKARLTELDFSYCYGIGESGLMEILPKLTELRYLQLSFCGWGRAFSDKVVSAMSQTNHLQLEILDIHSSFNITSETLCKFAESCPRLTSLCIGSANTSCEELETLLKNLGNLKHFYITKQATIKTETVFTDIKRFCPRIETLALHNFYAINRHRVEEALVELVRTCQRLKVLCIRGTNVPLRTELAQLADKVKTCTKRSDVEISRKPHFLFAGAKLCLDSVLKNSTPLN
ncbi:F-box/LRR-repeat protein 2-like [Stylophora pistillata]|uniref:F-box/LRR-repeat protein 2-like n=1 Tax=Stylophora pistillata TaxID=50429 RepID=UPI000C0529FE|nr:F-box/LRR-repeat protein 2-like [Stylophora pistillata]